MQRSTSRFRLARIATAAALAALVQAASAAAPLGAYNVRLDETSVSGISSGAYMAVQVGVAHSSIIKGVGAFAGGPYYCAQGSVTTATGTCMIGTPSAATSISNANSYAASGQIDATSNLAKQKVWIFSGYNDGVVKQPVVNALYDFYKNYTTQNNIYYRNNMNAGHAQVTSAYGGACQTTGGNFINSCGYDGAGKLLQHIYGRLNPRNAGALGGTFIQFDQDEFVPGDSWYEGMSHYGYAYVPAVCAAQQPCRVHVAFHGCKQYETLIGDAFYRNSGYNEWADTNSLIVLYPQTVATTVTPLNPNGCWDWWGHSDSAYATKNGSQIAAIKSMLNRVSANYSGWSPTPPDAFGTPSYMTATDKSNTRVALYWKPKGGTTTGYNVYRATAAAGPFTKINTALVKGASYSDYGRTPSSAYYYYVTAFNGSIESAASVTVTTTTAANPPSCDPYHRDNYTHTAEGRAYAWYGYTYAYGSNNFMGLWNIYSSTNLLRQSAGYYTVGTCA